ncbi:hypothetical protein GCU67_19545 [Modestobacter muralis]|uniref:Pentapeptide repeat-containing protein n=1 Tax=Modestobacter muralis TaxID=1608614 RepID=A0A6P0EXC1_9ACTN|nr:hypothetical protein [Modestobacter muralis]NEK96342.1 hypothetical protein [Modestobacter muralis]NEN53242.1 hypothetical protein [Modestobacter muralis]
MHEITYDELRAGARPSGDVDVRGGGVVQGVDLSGWTTPWLRFADATGLLDEVLPRPLKPSRVGKQIPVFVDCDFSGLTCARFDPGIARFVRCSFEDTQVAANLGKFSAHFEDCRFSGTWEANFDTEPARRDPARRVSIRGNDFTGCSGFAVQGGVPRQANTFDPDLHVVLWRGGPGWDLAVRLARQDVSLGNHVTSMQGLGPFYLRQDWVVLDQESVDGESWRQLHEASGT